MHLKAYTKYFHLRLEKFLDILGKKSVIGKEIRKKKMLFFLVDSPPRPLAPPPRLF